MNRINLPTCPTCGQALGNQEAVDRVREGHARQEREIQQRITAEASELAEAKVAAERARMQEDAIETAKEQRKRIKELENTVKQLQHQHMQNERRIEKMSAHERGELHEVDVYGQLLHAFPGDKMERRGRGADILHTVYAPGNTPQRAGVIVYECKDTIRWENGFIKQVLKAGATHRTPYLVLVTRALPDGAKTFCVMDDVIVVQPVHVLAIAEIVRKMVIEAHRAGLTTDRRDEKTAQLYDYLTSDDFRQSFGAIVNTADAMMSHLSEEKRAHERVWARRERVYADLAMKSSAVDAAIRAIVEDIPRDAKVIHIASRRRAS